MGLRPIYLDYNGPTPVPQGFRISSVPEHSLCATLFVYVGRPGLFGSSRTGNVRSPMCSWHGVTICPGTTPIDKEVCAAMTTMMPRARCLSLVLPHESFSQEYRWLWSMKFRNTHWGNPSSSHFYGIQARFRCVAPNELNGVAHTI